MEEDGADRGTSTPCTNSVESELQLDSSRPLLTIDRVKNSMTIMICAFMASLGRRQPYGELGIDIIVML